MTIQELYDWALENDVKDYEIIYTDEGCLQYPSYFYLKIDKERKEIIML